MKRFFFLISMMLFGARLLMANPIPFPNVAINELMFDSEQKWFLELVSFSSSEFPFTEIEISSSSGSAISYCFPVWENIEEQKLWVLTQDSLLSPLDFNPGGDRITVMIKFLNFEGKPDYYEAALTFGNCQGATVRAPKAGESIIYYDGIFSITTIPSMGDFNNSSVAGAKGTLTGKIYDKNQNLVTSGAFSFHEYSYFFNPIENGVYSIELFSYYFKKDYIYFTFTVSPPGSKIKVKPIIVDMEPGAVVEKDIYLLEELPGSAIDETGKTVNNFPFRVFPNPISSGQTLNYETGLPIKTMDSQVVIVSMDGRIVHQEKINNNAGTIHLPNRLSAGIYMVSLKTNNKIAYSERIVIE